VGGVVGETIMFHFHWEIYIVSHDTIDFADFVDKRNVAVDAKKTTQ